MPNLARDIQAKTRSQSGASMPLALLLFLICAMATAVVLMASTASAGRASQLAESDQLYYGVTSAANVFRDELLGDDGNGHTVTVALSKEKSATNATPTLTVLTDGVSSAGNASDGSYSVIEEAALIALFGTASPDESGKNAAWTAWPSITSTNLHSGDLAQYGLTLDGDGATTDTGVKTFNSLGVKVKPSVGDGGDPLKFTFQRTSGTEDQTLLTMTCYADYDANEVEDEDTTIKYVNVTWIPTSIEKS